MWLFKTPAVLHQVLYHLPVHQGLTAEEIHLQIHAVSGIGNQKIQCLFPYFKAHKSTSSMIFSLFCKAVFTCQVAVVGNVETKCFYHRLTLFKICDIVFIDVLRAQKSFFLQFKDFRKSLLQIRLRILVLQGICHDTRKFFFLYPFIQ